MNDTSSAETQIQTLETASPSDIEAKTKVKTFIKVLAIVTPLLSFAAQNWVLIMAFVLGGSIHSIELAMLAGGLVGVYLMPLIIMLLFQIGKRFRNPRSRWTIFLYTALFFLAVSCSSALVKLVV